jgi:manganese transport protein
MGGLVIPRWLAAISWAIAGLIVALNAKLLFDAVTS